MQETNEPPPDLPGILITDLQLHNARAYVSAVTALVVLSSLLVTIRVISRWKSLRNFTFDVYFIIAASVSAHTVRTRVAI